MGSYLIDTNVAIDYFAGKMPLAGLDFLDHVINQSSPYLSIIRQIELLGFNPSQSEKEFLKKFIHNSIIFPVFVTLFKIAYFLKINLFI